MNIHKLFGPISEILIQPCSVASGNMGAVMSFVPADADADSLHCSVAECVAAEGCAVLPQCCTSLPGFT